MGGGSFFKSIFKALIIILIIVVIIFAFYLIVAMLPVFAGTAAFSTAMLASAWAATMSALTFTVLGISCGYIYTAVAVAYIASSYTNMKAEDKMSAQMKEVEAEVAIQLGRKPTDQELIDYYSAQIPVYVAVTPQTETEEVVPPTPEPTPQSDDNSVIFLGALGLLGATLFRKKA